jgi:hypothetical protein
LRLDLLPQGRDRLQGFFERGGFGVALGLPVLDGQLRRAAALHQALERLAALRQQIERLPLGGIQRADHAVARHRIELQARQRAKGVHPLRPQPRHLIRRGFQGRVEATLLAARLSDGLLDRCERLPSGDHHITTSGSRRREPA